MRFSYAITNPPFGNMYNTCLDIKIANRINLFSDKQISIFPLTRITNKTPFKRKYIDSGHLKFIEAVQGNQLFDINTFSNYLGIYYFDMGNIFENIEINCSKGLFEVKPDFEALDDFYRTKILFDDDFVNLAAKYKKDYDFLVNRYGTLTPGKRKDWEYFKGRPDTEEYLKNYKHQIYIPKFSHERDPIHYSTPKLVPGHYFLTDKQNIFENLYYYFTSNFYNLYRRFYFRIGMDACKFKYIPALDFDIPTEDFKKIIDKLSDFSTEDIEILKKYKCIYENPRF